MAEINEPKIPGNLKLNIRTEMPTGSAQVLYLGSHPQHRLAIHVEKRGEAVKVETTTDTKLATGAKITDLSEATISWAEVSASNIINYFAGNNFLITGTKITSNPVTNEPRISLTQVNE